MSNRCAGEKSRDNPLFQRLILQIENHTSLREAEKNTFHVGKSRNEAALFRLYRESRPADQIADMRDLPGAFGLNLFSVREVKVSSDENEDLKLMK